MTENSTIFHTTNGPGGRPKVAGLFTGPVLDGGFMEAGYRAFLGAGARLGLNLIHLERVPPTPEATEAAFERLAAARPDLIIAHGGQNDVAAARAAPRHPAIRFAVTQGHVTGANLASYDVLQEHSAFLAGILAARTTKSGVVGHLSGIRVRPGLKGRAAFAHGVRHADASVHFATDFCGHQDDAALAEAAALALIARGVDRLFTMLNSGRAGATAACRAGNCLQIGNVDDWTAREPHSFIGSAMADVGIGVGLAMGDFAAGRFPAGEIRRIGFETDGAVGLAIHPSVPLAVRNEIAAARNAILRGEFAIDTEWRGPE
jgi:basic membrane protein A